MLINNAAFIPKNIVTAFQPMHNMMKMISTINNNLAIRKDSFTKSAELEKQMRMVMLEEENEKLVLPYGFTIKTMTPIETRLRVISSATQLIGQSKEYVSLIEKHETILADKDTTEEQRAISLKKVDSLKEHLEGLLEGTLFLQSGCINWFGKAYDRENNTNEFSELLKSTGDTSAEGLGLTGFENMNSTEILEKLDGALAHLNEMGKLVSPGYVPPEIVPQTQEELNRFERVAESWDYITGKLIDGVPKDPLPKFSVKI